MLTLGIDTSNYATSLAVFDTDAGEVVCDCKKFLPVKEGQLGLRQSDALFHHTAALPAMLAELGMNLKETRLVDTLSVAQKQAVEICKAVNHDCKLLIMDEPSATLTDKELKMMFAVMRRLVERGVTIIYISHRMEEIFDLASEITVLRDGRFVKTLPTAGCTREELIRLMVGRTLENEYPKAQVALGPPVLEARGLCQKGVFEDISFTLHRGEILGFSGLVGAGRTEVMLALFGAVPAEAGEIELRGKPCRIRRTRDAIDQKIAYCPEDRKQQGILPLRPVRDNISVVVLRGLCRGPFISSRRENAFARDYVEEFRIKTSSIEKPIYQLSGGNQQKALLARWLSAKPEILILDEPTKGIDVGAKAEIYRMICDVAAQGVAVILVSSELPEIIGLSDRIVVMRNQRVAGELDGRTATEEQVLRYAMLDNREGTT